jgi:transposase
VGEHDCQYKERVAELEAIVARQQAQLAAVERLEAELARLKKAVFGTKSERMPTPTEALKQEREPDWEAAAGRRRANAKVREEACVEEHEHSRVPDAQRNCPECGKEAKAISAQKTSTVVDYVPGYFRRRVIHRETVACSCGMYVQMAPPPPRVLGQSKYGAGFVAHLVVSKLLDSIPIYRMEKRFSRMGIPMARSTMNSLVLKAGFELMPLHKRVLELIAEQGVVLADETSLPVQQKKKCKRGFVWTFSARMQLGGEDDDAALIAFRYSKDRSGRTPEEILGGTRGVLVVDAYTGYNRVTDVDGRTRAGCLAHVRRKFFDARSGHEAVVDQALALILDIYRVEHEALSRGVVRSDEHAVLRRTKGRAAMDALHDWLKVNEPKYPPRSSQLGAAIRHALANWERLCVFLGDVNVPIDNNESERALRPVAKGRDNWLFAGHDDAAEQLMALLGLCASCEANAINPEAYLADVLACLDTHPASRLDELLPHRWRPVGEA